jgi:hypothetical protein
LLEERRHGAVDLLLMATPVKHWMAKYSQFARNVITRR